MITIIIIIQAYEEYNNLTNKELQDALRQLASDWHVNSN